MIRDHGGRAGLARAVELAALQSRKRVAPTIWAALEWAAWEVPLARVQQPGAQRKVSAARLRPRAKVAKAGKAANPRVAPPDVARCRRRKKWPNPAPHRCRLY